MPFQKIIFLVFAFVFSANGKPNEKPLKLLERLQNQISSIDPAPCPYCQDRPITAALSVKCIRDICGPPDPDVNFDILDSEALEKAQYVFENGLADKKIRGLSEKLSNFEVFEMPGRGFELAAQSQSHFEGTFRAIQNYLFMAQNLKNMDIEVNWDKENKKYVTTINEKTTRLKMASLNKKDQDWLLVATPVFYEKYYEKIKPSYDLYEQTPLEFFAVHSPEVSVSDALKNQAVDAEKNLKIYETFSPLAQGYILSKGRASLEYAIKQAKNGSIDESSTRYLLEFNAEINFYTAVSSDEKNNPFMLREGPTFAEIIRRAGGVKNAQDMEADQEGEKKNTKIMTDSQCYHTYLMDHELLPVESQVTNAKKDIATAKNLIRENILPRYSEETRKALAPILDKIDFNFPITKDQLDKDYAGLMERMIDDLEKRKKVIEAFSDEDLAAASAFMTASNSYPENNDQPTAEELELREKRERLNQWCSGFQYESTSDGNITALGAVEVSYATTKGNQEMRLGTFLHEIGHSLFAHLNSGKASDLSTGHFKAELDCLGGQHKERIPPLSLEKIKKNKMEAKYWYSSEDYPDAMAAIASRNLDVRNFGCRLQHLNSGKYNAVNFVGPDGNDHSSSLFRLINIQNLLGSEMPNSCQRYVRGKGGSFRNCAASQ